MGSWVADLGLVSSQSVLTWSTLEDRWACSLQGPEWLQCEASGTDSSWTGHLEFSAIPPLARDLWPADVCRIDLDGDVQESRLTVAGDSSVSAQIQVRVPQPWQSWLVAHDTWPHLEVELGRWGNFITSPADRLTASLRDDGHACSPCESPS